MSTGSTLTIVPPTQLTDAMLLDSNVPETDYPVWTAGTYAKGARVIVLSVHKVYESAVDGNTDNPLAPSATPKWVEVGATNRWKAFDKAVNSQTKQADLITYKIKPGKGTSFIGFLNLVGASSVQVIMTDPVRGEVYNSTKTMRNRLGRTSWWSWFFDTRSIETEALFNDLPPFPNAELEIVITGNAELGVGVIIFGRQVSFTMGVQTGARLGIQDFSKKERNAFGDITVVERAHAKIASFSAMLLASEVDAFYDFCVSVRSQPCLWIAGRYESATIYGFYKSFNIIISYYDYSDCDIELESLT